MMKKIFSTFILTLLLGVFLLPHFAHADITTGLVAHWAFDEGSGSTANDSTGNSNTATLNGTVGWTTNSKVGPYAISYPGVSGSGVTPTTITTGTTFTYAEWVYITEDTDGYQNIYTEDGTQGIWVRFKLIDFYFGGDHLSNTFIPVNSWHHIAVVNNAGAVTFYLDGVADGTTSSAPSFNANGMGCDGGNGGECFGGNVDDARLYNRALSSGDIAELYADTNTTSVLPKKWTIQTPPNSLALGNGLVGWWTFDGKDTPWTSSTAATTLDRSGNSNTGTLTNMNRSTTPTPGKFGQALKFDGVDDYVVTTGNIPSMSAFTVSAWVKPNGSQVPFFRLAETDFTSGFYLGGDSTGTQYEFIAENTLFEIGGTVTPGVWTHVVGIYDGTRATLYVNGVDVSHHDFPLSATAALPLYLGSPDSSPGSSELLKGSLDDVRVYNRALSAAEVQKLSTNGIGKIKATPLVVGPSCVPSYTNTGGRGDRRSIIDMSLTTINTTGGSALIDGDTVSNGRNFFNGNTLDGTTGLIFDFGSGHAPIITESKYYQQDSTAQGTWKWRGSNDASTWTDIGGTFSLATSPTTISTTMSGNTTGYRYYQLLGVSGLTSNGPWIYQMEFKICGY